jgi:hypothetical protein
MNIKAKEYRKTLNTSYQKYKEKCASELRALSKNDTKGFWKTLKKYSGNRKETQNSSILISLSSSSHKFKFLKYSKNVSISTGGVSFLLPEYFFKVFQNP